LRLIKEIHSVLMKGVRGGKKMPGEFKKSQNWIGPAGATLNEATFVPPPPHEAEKAIGELEKYMHKKEKLPILVDCALIHYQFETIHPFLDGNGRLGRLLITYYLYWKGVLTKPLLYLSYFFKKRRQEYYDRLSLVRENGDYEQWVSFFLTGVIEISDSAIDTSKRILELQSNHRNLLWKKKISSPLAVGILEKLFYVPYVSVNDVAKEFSISFQAASTLVAQFEKARILKEITGRKRDKRYIYADYINILSEGTK
ncbi:MAG TPA: Fic family protein, partial [Dissulfurispiraceae bacterium]|nr:Fic family protein [Dissulfurispiraceae bacterium]